MISRCCGKLLTTTHDGCLQIKKTCGGCGKEYKQRKRRPEIATSDQECTWVVPCADHTREPRVRPYEPPRTRPGTVAHDYSQMLGRRLTLGDYCALEILRNFG